MSRNYRSVFRRTIIAIKGNRYPNCSRRQLPSVPHLKLPACLHLGASPALAGSRALASPPRNLGIWSGGGAGWEVGIRSERAWRVLGKVGEVGFRGSFYPRSTLTAPIAGALPLLLPMYLCRSVEECLQVQGAVGSRSSVPSNPTASAKKYDRTPEVKPGIRYLGTGSNLRSRRGRFQSPI